MTRTYRVGVVGCGVAGATVAHLLAQDGHTVTVLEQAPELTATGAGILLQLSGQTVLEHLGVREQVLAHSTPLTELYARQTDGRELICTRYADYGPNCQAYGAHRGVIFQAILNLLNGRVEVRTETAIVKRVIGANGVSVVDSLGRTHGPFDFLIAADGSRSRLRAVCGIKARICVYDHGTLWMIAPVEVPGRLLQVVRGNRYLFGLMPTGLGLCTMYWGLPTRDYARTMAAGLEPIKAEILKFAPEAEPVLECLFDIRQLLFTNYQHVTLSRWHDAHTLFLGDAAHAMSPHLGQGLNLALVDAYRFAQCLRTASTPERAFSAFRVQQRAYLRYYATLTYLLSPFFQSDYPLLAWGRDRVLPHMMRVPYLKEQMLLTVTGMKRDVFGGPMTF